MDAIAVSDDLKPGPPVSAVPPEKPAAQPESRARNPNLDSFEAVMEAMDAELQKTRDARKQNKTSEDPPAGQQRSTGAKPTQTRKGSTKGKERQASSDSEDDEDVETAMDSELRRALKKGEGGASDSEEDDVEGTTMDYNLIKNFLESFKSQAGMAGPVSNLAGRLEKGWSLPRDEGH